MVASVSADISGSQLRSVLENLRFGDTITLVNSDGSPLAVVVSVKPERPEIARAGDWQARWDALAQKVSQAWRGSKSAVDTISEMRR